MRNILNAVLVASVVAVSSFAVEYQNEMDGVWVAVSVDRHGTMLTPEQIKEQKRKVTIQGDTFTFEEILNGEPVNYGGTFTVNPDNQTFDLVGVGPRGAPWNILAIYELNGDELRFCYRRNADGTAERPTEFKAVQENPNYSMVYVCKRIK